MACLSWVLFLLIIHSRGTITAITAFLYEVGHCLERCYHCWKDCTRTGYLLTLREVVLQSSATLQAIVLSSKITLKVHSKGF